jgi:hypothetical protein
MTHPSKIGHNRDGLYRRQVINYSTASTATYNVSVEQSGAIFYCPTVSTINMALPRISSKWLGLEYTFYFSTADATGDYQISCPFDSSAGIYIPGMSSDGVGTPSTITPMSTIWPHAIKVTALSSVVWLGEPIVMVGDITTNAIQDEDFEGGCWTTQ